MWEGVGVVTSRSRNRRSRGGPFGSSDLFRAELILVIRITSSWLELSSTVKPWLANGDLHDDDNVVVVCDGGLC